MNTSRKTRIIAEGIALWAFAQDNTEFNSETAPLYDKWMEWQANYPIYVEFVKAEQFRLFDLINAAF
jgi:hypothetical protein